MVLGSRILVGALSIGGRRVGVFCRGMPAVAGLRPFVRIVVGAIFGWLMQLMHQWHSAWCDPQLYSERVACTSCVIELVLAHTCDVVLHLSICVCAESLLLAPRYESSVVISGTRELEGCCFL